MNVSPEGEAQTQSISACVDRQCHCSQSSKNPWAAPTINPVWCRRDTVLDYWQQRPDTMSSSFSSPAAQILRSSSWTWASDCRVKVSVIWRLVDSLSSVQLCFIDRWVDADWLLQLFSVRNLCIVMFRRAFVRCDPAVMYKRVETLVRRSISCSTDLWQKAQRLSCHQALRWRQFER